MGLIWRVHMRDTYGGFIWRVHMVSVAAEMQTSGICAYVAMGGLITPLLIYMPFLYVARSSDP